MAPRAALHGVISAIGQDTMDEKWVPALMTELTSIASSDCLQRKGLSGAVCTVKWLRHAIPVLRKLLTLVPSVYSVLSDGTGRQPMDDAY